MSPTGYIPTEVFLRARYLGLSCSLEIYLRVIIDQLENGVAALAAALKFNASKTKAMIWDFIERIPHDLPRTEVSGIHVPYVGTAENLSHIKLNIYLGTPDWSGTE